MRSSGRVCRWSLVVAISHKFKRVISLILIAHYGARLAALLCVLAFVVRPLKLLLIGLAVRLKTWRGRVCFMLTRLLSNSTLRGQSGV